DRYPSHQPTAARHAPTFPDRTGRPHPGRTLAAMILVDLDGVAVRRPDRPLFEGLSLTVQTGDRLGVVGRNGSGKSTLLRILAGDLVPEEGAVRRGRGIRI